MGTISAPTHINEEHDLSGFDCGKASLNNWLIRQAFRNERGGGSRTYVVCEENLVVGYYALAAGSIEAKEVPGKIKRNMPNPIPAIILGRLAVRTDYCGNGIGEGLLKDALLRSISAAEQVGSRVLLVHALDNDASNFYLKRGFIRSTLNENILILPLTI